MMKFILSLMLMLGLANTSDAQFSKASLQASGLTCSMCSKAVKEALEHISFVEKVMVDIKNQQYNISFKKDAPIDFDALSKAVEDAGFSVAAVQVTADLNQLKVQKDDHILIGDKYFHFLNANNQELNGSVTFKLVDKAFLPSKEFKKYSARTKMECVQTGKAGKCCANDKLAELTRIYHVII